MFSDTKSETEETEKTWLDYMSGYLNWKVVGPEIHNPFSRPIPLYVLSRLASSRSFLLENLKIRCLCEGYEVMIVQNLGKPRILTDHPCVLKLSPEDVLRHLETTELAQKIDREIERIHADIREEYNRREDNQRQEDKKTGSKSLKKREEEKQPNYGGGPRIIRKNG